jgi:hypothetical protein
MKNFTYLEQQSDSVSSYQVNGIDIGLKLITNNRFTLNHQTVFLVNLSQDSYVYIEATEKETSFDEIILPPLSVLSFCLDAPCSFIVNNDVVANHWLGFIGISNNPNSPVNRLMQLVRINPSAGAYRYIDGCTDSLLIPPIIKGNDCLNVLYFPPNTKQTAHTHPSLRLGFILSGTGICHYESDCNETLIQSLNSYGRFILLPEVLHHFETESEPMVVLAYHPDSDVGLTDDNHPMVNLTLVNGLPVRLLVK